MTLPPTVVHERTEDVEHGVCCANGAVHMRSRFLSNLDDALERFDKQGCGPHYRVTRVHIVTAWEAEK